MGRDRERVGSPGLSSEVGTTLASVSFMAKEMGMTGKCVLIVDDNEDNRTMYVVALRHYGYRVLEAADGEAAVAVAVAERPDLILMDLQMPKVNGFQATEQLKARADTAAIPVIALTGLAMSQDRAMALAAGCDDYYAKPLEPRNLADVVARWLNGPGMPEASP